jgi:hypothetical protein
MLLDKTAPFKAGSTPIKLQAEFGVVTSECRQVAAAPTVIHPPGRAFRDHVATSTSSLVPFHFENRVRSMMSVFHGVHGRRLVWGLNVPPGLSKFLPW